MIVCPGGVQSVMRTGEILDNITTISTVVVYVIVPMLRVCSTFYSNNTHKVLVAKNKYLQKTARH